MLIRLNHRPVIDNLRNYPREIVERLGTALCGGVIAEADPRRKGFYDISDGDRSFFIHISPVTGHVWLLASWLGQAEVSPAPYAANFMGRAASAAHLY
jgi:hypothetical protein